MSNYLDMRGAFTYNFLHVVKIFPSEERRPVATEDLVGVVSLVSMIPS